MPWPTSAFTSNRLLNTYIKGFVDVSGGDLILRNGDIIANEQLVVHGDVSLNNHVTISKTLTAENIILNGNTPQQATSTGTIGQIIVDDNYIYVCTGINTWKRASLSTW